MLKMKTLEQMAARLTDRKVIDERLRTGAEIVTLQPGQVTTPAMARLTGLPHTVVKPQRWF